jgi:hypothetical protein
VYYLLSLFTELYTSPSFLNHPGISLFIQSAAGVAILVCIKIPVVYFILEYLIANWTRNKNNNRLIYYSLITILAGTVLTRICMYVLIWPLIYQEAAPEFHFLSFVARFIYSFLDIIQVAGIAVCIKLYFLRMQSVSIEKKLILEKSRAELRQLKSQINPHFLFNTLNSIYSLSRTQSEQTPESIMRLSKILRFTLYESDKKTIPLEEELKMIRDFIDLQNLRFLQRVAWKMDISLDEPAVQITPLLLLPIIENAYTHCNESKAEIIFRLELHNKVLKLYTGNPASNNALSGKGSGLKNMERQLQLLYKVHTLHYEISQSYFKLELIVDLKSYSGNELFDY